VEFFRSPVKTQQCCHTSKCFQLTDFHGFSLIPIPGPPDRYESFDATINIYIQVEPFSLSQSQCRFLIGAGRRYSVLMDLRYCQWLFRRWVVRISRQQSSHSNFD
jgi:hypothetical protein